MWCSKSNQPQTSNALTFEIYVQILCVLSLIALLSTSACLVPADGNLGSTQGALDYTEDAVSYSDVGFEEEELETTPVFRFVNDPYCAETVGTPTLGLCKDRGCKKRGGKCKAVDSDRDGIRDNCRCIGAKRQSPGEVSPSDDEPPTTPGDTYDDGDEDDIGPLPAPKPAVSTASGGCTVTAGTIYGICADSGCKKRGGKCKAVDTDSDQIFDDCKCIGATKGTGTSDEAVFNY